MKRIVVGAHYGLKDWLAQRVTAVIMAVFTIFMIAAMVGGAVSSAEAWREFMGHGAVRIASLLFAISLFYHAWIGVRDIWMDYVKPAGLRLTLHVLTALALVAYLGWTIQILWRL
jgi:succinate dehydrogenase / fumarate reductase, membrane anchor subunit